MSVIGSNILAGSSGQGGYFLTNSLRFRASASAYLNRTQGTSTNQSIGTWSFWCKRGALGTTQRLFEGYTASSDTGVMEFEFDTNNCFYIGGWATNWRITTQVFRDPSAWYHFVVTVDTTQATANNRIRVYVNGSEITSFSTLNNPGQNSTFGLNNNSAVLQIGRRRNVSNNDSFVDGYLTEINFIDGQALTPSSFGETSASTGVWIPKKYTGTYGTNGFYLPFTDTTSTSTLGNDFSGNGNTWTVNNISLTAGSTYDSMTDVPTLTSATAANFAVLNPLARTNSAMTIQDGNLTTTQTATGNLYVAPSTMVLPTIGKFYAEFRLTSTVSSGNGGPVFGVSQNDTLMNTGYGNNGKTVGYYNAGGSGTTYRNGTNASGVSGLAPSGGDIVQVAVDCATGNVWLGKNNTWYGGNSGVPTAIGDPSAGSNPIATLSSTDVANGYVFFVAISDQIQTNGWTVNFGQRPFSYTPPSGFVALNTFNLPTPTIGATASTTANKYFDALTWTGDGASPKSRTGYSFAPDLVWTKGRSQSTDNALFDRVRGTGSKVLESNLTDAENNYGLTVDSFDANGFTTSNGSFNHSYANTNGTTYVGWAWKANGAGSTNTAGSITSTVSANTSAGFSIVTYTGTGSNATVGHGLGVAPSMVIVKRRNGGSDNWQGYHISLGKDYTIKLNTTQAQENLSDYWGTGGVTSTVFGINGSYSGINANGGTYVAYCFAQIAGYSAFGSYTGNGSSDGTFVYTNFAPSFVMVKRTDTTGNWFIIDNKRLGYNGGTKNLYPNLSNAEATLELDLVSNGFKWRLSGADVNASGGTYIYMAFCESPFKFSNAR